LLHQIIAMTIAQLRQMSGIEGVAVLTGLISVYLTVRNNIWTWPWGIVNVVLYGWIFWQQKVYANAGLNALYFLPMQFYGWWVWAKCGPRHHDDLPITVYSNRERIAWTCATVLISMLAGAALRYLPPIVHWDPDPMPYADGITTGISIVAQYMEARKKIENWILWIVADVIYVFYLLPQQHLYLSALLNVFYLVLAVMGALAWWRLLAEPQPAQQNELVD
jgi:nicotinamide mononucleotide transporter